MENDASIKLDANIFCEQTKELEDFLLSRVVNQNRAIKCIVSAYDMFNSPLWQPTKPILSSLFLGPSAVGKTYVAEMLADYFFDNPNAFTKIECANYAEHHEIAKLVGAPPGYVGHNESPLLSQENIDSFAVNHAEESIVKIDKKAQWLSKEVERARQSYLKSNNQTGANSLIKIYKSKINDFQNYIAKKKEEMPLISIILFDEIEKANQSLHNFLLEITSKGRVRLGNGRETLFYNSFIIMTSNAGSRIITDIVKGKREIGFAKEEAINSNNDEIYSRAMIELRKIFSTEFLGRIEKDVIVFRHLSLKDLEKILDIQINDLKDYLNRNFPIELTITEKVKKLIIEKACDHPEYGARLLNDKIDKYIKEPLARMINSNQILGGDKITIGLKDGSIVFLKQQTKENLNSTVAMPAK